MRDQFKRRGVESGTATDMDLAIFLANNALAPRPGALPLVVLPRGACGTTTFAACEGLCSGWTSIEEESEVETEDIVI